MLISLTNTIFYDTRCVYEKQSESCKKFIQEIINKVTPTFNYDDTNRPFEYLYQIPNSNNFIVITQIWNSSPPSCTISQSIISVRGDEIWHEKNCSIQVKISFENNLLLLQQFPELGMYLKMNKIGSHIQSGYVYLYLNYIYLNHRQLLQNFGAIIKERE